MNFIKIISLVIITFCFQCDVYGQLPWTEDFGGASGSLEINNETVTWNSTEITISGCNTVNVSIDLTSLRLEQQHLLSGFKTLENEETEIEQMEKLKNEEITKAERVIEGDRLTEQKALRAINEATKLHDKLLNKRSMFMETIQTKQKLIRELGTLPRSELDNIKSLSEKQLLDELAIVNERLKRFAGVNRKATALAPRQRSKYVPKDLGPINILRAPPQS